MEKKTFKRIQRKGKLTAEEATRDQELRRKIQEEFPPLETGPVSPVLSHPLREAIAHSGKSVRDLANEARVSEVVLQQFLDDETRPETGYCRTLGASSRTQAGCELTPDALAG